MLAFPGSSECKIIYSLFNICQSLVTVAPAQLCCFSMASVILVSY